MLSRIHVHPNVGVFRQSHRNKRGAALFFYLAVACGLFATTRLLIRFVRRICACACVFVRVWVSVVATSRSREVDAESYFCVVGGFHRGFLVAECGRHRVACVGFVAVECLCVFVFVRCPTERRQDEGGILFAPALASSQVVCVRACVCVKARG